MSRNDETLIISDIGGEYDALMELVKDHEGRIVLVGDLNDRGPKSREVIQWAIDNEERVTTLESNHGHMFWNYPLGFTMYDPSDFTDNGGLHTLMSYGYKPDSPSVRIAQLVDFVRANVPIEHLEFLATRPVFIELENAIVSHAPVPNKSFLAPTDNIEDELRQTFYWIWNRSQPKKLPANLWQIFGHNSHWGLMINEKNKSICLDDSRKGLLTGMYWPSKEIVQVRFREEKK